MLVIGIPTFFYPKPDNMNEQMTVQYELSLESMGAQKSSLTDTFEQLIPQQLSVEEQQSVIKLATDIVMETFKRWKQLQSPEIVREQLRILLATRKDEVFWILLLDSKHRMIEFKEMFSGTVCSASVYPRVIVRTALELNAAATILVHNHPSWVPEPSEADELITTKVKESLALIDVRVLDHVVVGTEGTVSFAERGLI